MIDDDGDDDGSQVNKRGWNPKAFIDIVASFPEYGISPVSTASTASFGKNHHSDAIISQLPKIGTFVTTSLAGGVLWLDNLIPNISERLVQVKQRASGGEKHKFVE